MLGLYRSLLALYPPLHRYVFGEEMLAVLREARAEEWRKGIASRASFCVREVFGLLRGALAAHRDDLAETYPWFNWLQRSFPMTPEPRYPRTSIALMSVILGITVAIIAKAQGIAYSLAQFRADSAGLPRPLPWDLGTSVAGWPVHYGLLASIALGFIATWMLGVTAWAVMHALRRSGVHRLDDAQTWPQSRA